MNEQRWWQGEIELAIKKIADVAEQRKDENALTRCRMLFRLLRKITPVQRSLASRRGNKKLVERFEYEMFRLAEDISMVINLELREIVYPLPDIKESTHRFGMMFAPSKYLNWMPEDRLLSPEEAISYLEHQLDSLSFALELFRKHRRGKALSHYA